MTPFEGKTDPYIQGVREPAPAVMWLNGTLSSFAVTMLLAIVAGVLTTARRVLYNALTSVLRRGDASERSKRLSASLGPEVLGNCLYVKS